MHIRSKVMQGEISKLCLVIATLALGPAGAGAEEAGVACVRGRSWWDRQQQACAPCTRCDPQQFAVRYPCELHRDTICQPLHEVHIYPFNVPKENESELSDYEYYDYADYEVSDDEGEVKWDMQSTTLTVAASGCVVFFVVVLYFSFYNSKQWKVLKQALRTDVQDLSAKLKLMEAGETPAEPVVPTDHHIYCNIHVAKDALLGPASTKKGLGNVYTQEKHST